MEIIAQVNREEFIVKAGENEIAKIMGFYYTSEKACPQIKVGMKLDVSSVYKRITDLRSSKKKLSEIAKELRAYADIIDEKENPVLALLSEE